MPLTNIIDHRERPYRFLKVNAVIEPTRPDNSVKDSDKAKRDQKMDKNWIGYDEREHITVSKAIQWAEKHSDFVTLYLYDEDGGIYLRRPRKKGRSTP